MIELHNADCIHFLQDYDGASIDYVFADPPYSSGGAMRSDRTQSTKTKYISSDSQNQIKLQDFEGDNKDQRAYAYWSHLWMSLCYQRMNTGAMIGVFTDWRQLPTTADALQGAGFVWRGILPWYKSQPRPMADRYTNQCEYLIWGTKGARSIDGMKDGTGRYADGFFSYNPPRDRVHVTEKPVELYRHLFKIVKDGETILDPFIGSGSSLLAAHDLGVNIIGLEYSEPIYAAAVKRLTDHQSQLVLL